MNGGERKKAKEGREEGGGMTEKKKMDGKKRITERGERKQKE